MSRGNYRTSESKEEWRGTLKQAAAEYNDKISMVYLFVVGHKRTFYDSRLVKRVGRSDDIKSRGGVHIRAVDNFGRHKKHGKISKVKFCFIVGPQRHIHSFCEESLQYHLYGGKKGLEKNEQHPEQPHNNSNRKYECPVCGGVDSNTYEHHKVESETYYRDW